MKYIKKYELNQTFYSNLNDLKKYVIIQDKRSFYYFIMEFISADTNDLTCVQLYHCPENGKIIKDGFIRPTTISEQLPEYKFIFHSDTLQECIDKLELMNSINKYNL